MARVRMPDEPALKSWDDVDMNLKEIGEYQLELELIEAAMNHNISDIKLDAELRAKPLKDAIKVLEGQIKNFAQTNRDDLGSQKTMFVNFGKLGFRKSTRVKLPRAVLDVIKRLKSYGMTDCVILPPEKVDRDALKKYPEADILKVGASLDVSDVFWYEVDREKLANF